jgi:phenylalanyl-tRNA synthetase beta chain
MTKVGAKMSTDYKLVEDTEDARFFTRRGVSILLKGRKIGSMGVIHPEVLGNFELKYPVSALELEFDTMFDHFKNIQ